MHSAELQNHLQSLRAGRCDPAFTSYLEQASASSLVAELLTSFPIVFQQRAFEHKREIGLAREAACLLKFRRQSNSAFPVIVARPSLVHCLLMSAYHDTVSEITWAGKIQVRSAAGGLVLSFGKGYKLDKMVDGWSLKPLRARKVTLSEELLSARGWKFDALLPFGSPVAVSKSA